VSVHNKIIDKVELLTGKKKYKPDIIREDGKEFIKQKMKGFIPLLFQVTHP
jgi:hypothetical protein